MKELYILDIDCKLTDTCLAELQQTLEYKLILVHDEARFNSIIENQKVSETAFYIYAEDNQFREYKTSCLENKDFKCQSLINKTNKRYSNTVVGNSFLSQQTIVGDNSRIEESILSDYCKIERNNLVRQSFIGKYSYTGEFTKIFDTSIGKFVSIGWNVSIGAHEHIYTRISTHSFIYQDFNKRFNLLDKAIDDSGEENRQTEIGNDVWIGCHAIIKRGVCIGYGAIIGSGSVVTKDVPPYAIVVGTPAHIIKYRFSEEIIEKLLEIEWWNWSPERIKLNEHLFLKEKLEIEDFKKIK